ncbi:hypothetical protein AB4Z50_27500 [Paenibacillus sp. 2TAB26]|uniref:hypothetical protein n=1 Tax=Paenibacillus sp. 2TAB26 TaxID=3233005 RepID=UPI003F9CC591
MEQLFAHERTGEKVKGTFVSAVITVLLLAGCAAESVDPKATNVQEQQLVQAKLTGLLDKKISPSFNITDAKEISISRVTGAKSKESVYTDQRRLEVFVSAINTAVQMQGILNMSNPIFTITVKQQFVKNTFNLWINASSKQGVIMDVKDTHKGYVLTKEATNELLQIIQEDSQLTEQSEFVMPLAYEYEKVENAQKVAKVDHIQMEQLIKEQNINDGKISIYSKSGDAEQVYGAFESEAGLYELGAVGGMHSQNNDELLSIKELELYGKSLIRIDGVFGANAPIHNYFEMKDGKPIPFLLVDTGHAEEVDVDGDAIEEVVSKHGLPLLTFVYKWEDGAFKVGEVESQQ